MHTDTAPLTSPLPPLAPEIAALLTGPRTGRRMDVSELPSDYLTTCLPTARPVHHLANGKRSTRWQAVIFKQSGAHEHPRFLWSSHDLYEDRDEALEVAALKADRFAVADYLDTQGKVSLPLRSPADAARNGGEGVPEQPDLAHHVAEQQHHSLPPTG